MSWITTKTRFHLYRGTIRFITCSSATYLVIDTKVVVAVTIWIHFQFSLSSSFPLKLSRDLIEDWYLCQHSAVLPRIRCKGRWSPVCEFNSTVQFLISHHCPCRRVFHSLQIPSNQRQWRNVKSLTEESFFAPLSLSLSGCLLAFNHSMVNFFQRAFDFDNYVYIKCINLWSKVYYVV